jgi:hypothetical protein
MATAIKNQRSLASERFTDSLSQAVVNVKADPVRRFVSAG